MKTSYVLIILFALQNLMCSNMKKESKNESNHDKEFVPQWAKKAIWYQIFPERFRNGDTSNDPSQYDIIGADPQELPKEWQIHPWTSDWYKLQDYEKANGEPELWKHLLRRRYGGDLQGIIDKLDYISDLGINAIYLNPIFDSPSLHKYDGNSYHHVDPNFGPDPKGDRQLMLTENPLEPETWVWTKADLLALELIKKAHSKGIRIIFDGVFNHMGINSFAFKDVQKRQEESEYKDWFIIKSWNNPKTGSTFDYEGWFGVKSLPELREDENGIVDGPKNYIFAATQRWMNPKNEGIENGIDGWRLDVAFCIAHPFWKDWRKWVKEINPEAYLTAEIIDKPEKVIPYFKGDEFDAEMNYNFAFSSAEYFFDSPEFSLSPSKFADTLNYLRELYPSGVAYATMNLFGSHDANRIASHIVNRGIERYRNWGAYFGKSKPIDNPEYSSRKPNDYEIQLQKLFVLFQFTYVGAPMIYYGDEVGMWGGNDPDCRKPMVWDDYKYENENTLPNQKKGFNDKVEVNHDLLNFYKQMISIRNDNEELQIGDYETIITDDSRNIFGFRRSLNNQEILVLINNSDEKHSVTIQNYKGTYQNLLNNQSKEISSKVEIELAPKSGIILKKL